MSDKDEGKNNPETKDTLPKDAQAIISVMKDCGITNYDPRVVNQLLEYVYRYVTSVLNDARVFADHANKRFIDEDDVELAVQTQLEKSFSTTVQRELLVDIARSVNFNPLPLLNLERGPQLPPDRYCLSTRNYRLEPATMKILNKPPIPTAPDIKTVATQKPNVTQQKVVSVSNPNVPKPILKFIADSKVVKKPVVPDILDIQTLQMEMDEKKPKKRKLDDKDNDV